MNISVWSMIQAILKAESESTDDEKSTRETIAEILIGEVLVETGDTENEFIYTRIMTDSGLPDAFAFDEDKKTLRLCLLVGRLGQALLPDVSSTVVLAAPDELVGQLKRIVLDDAPINEQNLEGLGQFIFEFQNTYQNLEKIELSVIVLGKSELLEDDLSAKIIKIGTSKSIEVNTRIYDIPRIQNRRELADNSGTVDIDLLEFIGGPLSCLEVSSKGSDVRIFLAIFPGDALAKIYERYRSRVLQKNLRNYLQATGKVNKGILKTLKERPERFLAYNNGLTVTASNVQLNAAGKIVRLEDFQIVNGGQTTASLDHAKRFLGLSLDKVSVQAKINVIDVKSNPDFIDDVSNFANSQNKVKTSDFAARDSFQEKLSKLMRDNEELLCERENGARNFWYYEAFRGGYETDRYLLPGRARRQFETTFPKNQVIDKIELAKIENAWDGYPHFVCRGADMNFSEWVKRTKPHFRSEPTIEYCQDLIAKAILFRSFAQCVKSQQYPALQSQILAISYSYFQFLLEKDGKEINLHQIWVLGSTQEELNNVILEVIEWVRKLLKTQSGELDPAQWAKRSVAWDKIKSIKSPSPPKVLAKLLRLDLIRDLTLNFEVTCAKACDAISKSTAGMSRQDFLSELNIKERDWDSIRKALLKDYDVVSRGTGKWTKYFMDVAN
jgi:hypothetical protein